MKGLTDLSGFWIAFACGLVFTPTAGALGSRFGIIDNPGRLSIHAGSIPRTAGLTMFIGFLMSMSYAWSTRLLAGLAIRTHTGYRHADRPVLPGQDHNQPRVR